MERRTSPIDFSESYKTRWRLMKVNADTWEDMGELLGLRSAKVNRSCTDDYPMLESADLTVDAEVGYDLEEGYYRLEAAVKQGSSDLIPVSTLFLSSPSGSTNRKVVETKVNGTSVLQGAKERLVLFGDYAPKGADGAEYAASLLRQCIPAPVVVHGSFTLDNHVVFGEGVEYIKAVWTVLDAANWCMRITSDGTVHIQAKPDTPAFYLDKTNAKYVQPGVTYDDDRISIPNHYVAVDGTQREEVYNEDPNSSVSKVTRGRIVDYMDTDPIRVNGETLYSYCQRQLEELSTIVKTYSYKRAYREDVLPFDMIECSLRDIGMEGVFRVMTQSIDCGHGITVEEKVGKELKEYTAS